MFVRATAHVRFHAPMEMGERQEAGGTCFAPSPENSRSGAVRESR